MVKANVSSIADAKHFPLSKIALDYLIKVRKLSPISIDAYGLDCNEKGEIQISFIDHEGTVKAVKRRAPDGSMLQRKRHDTETGWINYECKTDAIVGSKAALFGTQLVQDFSKPLLITFGEYDALTIHSLDQGQNYNVVSPPFGDKSLTWIDHQFEWLEKFDQVIIFPDFDSDPKVRKHLFDKIDELGRRLGKHRCLVVQERYVLDAKDPNDLYLKYGADAVWAALLNVEYIPEPGLESLAHYEAEEFVEGVPTGYKDFDSATGGLIYGGLTIMSGDNNAGKTTNILNLIANVVSGGYGAFYWSGEQKPDKYRWWIEQIMAGPNFVEDSLSMKTGRVYHFLRRDLIPLVRDWYSDKLFHYNKRGFETEEFFRILELAVRRHGIFLICIDNLMAFTGDAEEYYQTQAAFVESCKNFAIEWNVHIVLATHNRKNDPNKPGSKDDIEGSKKIGNWADSIIQVFRVGDHIKEKYNHLDAIWSLVKNRETEDLVDIGMMFDPRSKRLYQAADPETISKLYGWETDEILKGGKYVDPTPSMF